MVLTQMKQVISPDEAGAIASYDYFDIAEGTGIINFYGIKSFASGAVHKYSLTTDNTVYSETTAERVKSTGDGVWRNKSDVNYDITLNYPKIIYGKARISATQGILVAAGTNLVYLNFSLKKYDGTTETLMASGATAITSATTGTKSETKLVPLDLTSQKWKFKKDDILRLNVQLWELGGSATSYMGYGCDPQNRDDVADASGSIVIEAGEPTQLKVSIPFRIDI